MSRDTPRRDTPQRDTPKHETRRALGRRGEALAEAYLRRHGFRILARNLHLRYAEVDLVALDGRALCIIEVRTRSSSRFGSPAESVDGRKRRRLVRAARELIAARRWPRYERVRFDVVGVDTSHDPPKLSLIRDAFHAD